MWTSECLHDDRRSGMIQYIAGPSYSFPFKIEETLVMRRFTASLAFCVLLLTLLGGVMASPVAAQGKSEAAQLCQNDGYLDYTRQDGSTFKNAGQCTSYAAQGNELESVSVADLSFAFDFNVNGSGLNVVTWSGSGLMPGSVVTLDIYFVDGTSVLGRELYGGVDANGDFAANSSFECDVFTSATLNGIAANGTPISESADSPC